MTDKLTEEQIATECEVVDNWMKYYPASQTLPPYSVLYDYVMAMADIEREGIARRIMGMDGFKPHKQGE